MPQWCGSFFTQKADRNLSISLFLPNFNLKNLFQTGQNQRW